MSLSSSLRRGPSSLYEGYLSDRTIRPTLGSLMLGYPPGWGDVPTHLGEVGQITTHSGLGSRLDSRRGFFICSSNLSKTAPAPHRASQGYLADCSTSIHAPTMLGARLGLRLVTALLGEMWPQLWPSPAPISCLPPYVYSTERAESKSSHAYYLKVYARYHYP